MSTKRTFCRICAAYCGVIAETHNGNLVQVKGDPDHALSKGYSCVKGRRLPQLVNHEHRLATSFRRAEDGSLEAIKTNDAIAEIATKLQRIIQEHGPRAVATYTGTGCWGDFVLKEVVKAWHVSIGSVMRCSSASIDQPAKTITPWHLGVWGGGPNAFDSAKVIMLIGQNPIVSGQYQHGGPPYPSNLQEARKRGLKVIVVDPRATELAQQSDIHLQVIPGEDPTLMAGMLRIILSEKLHDADFCDGHVAGLDELEKSVADFTLGYVSQRCGISEDKILAAARLFASENCGVASTGTGPSMSPLPNLTEHLVQCLNTVCGRWNRTGDQVNMPGILTPDAPRPAQALPAEFLPADISPIANSEVSRIRGIRQVYQEMPTAALADEILTPGDGQVKALIVVGGNPVLAWPDQPRTLKAMEELELLVCLDIRPTETAEYADYSIACSHHMERAELSFMGDYFFEKPFSQYTDAIAHANSEQIDEWRFFAGIARKMQIDLELPGGKLSAEHMSDMLAVFELVRPETKVPIADIMKYSGGHLFDEIDVRVCEPFPGIEARLNVGHAAMLAELRGVRQQTGDDYTDRGFTHRLISRRVKYMQNSVGLELPRNPSEKSYNPAYLHPDDLASLALKAGDIVRLHSEDGSILAVVEPAADVRPGVISMAHCFGGNPKSNQSPALQGSSTAALISVEHHYDPISGQARQSAIPIRIEAAPHMH
jgi:anaerobic selenocysteine-containing dehydrogenase